MMKSITIAGTLATPTNPAEMTTLKMRKVWLGHMGGDITSLGGDCYGGDQR